MRISDWSSDVCSSDLFYELARRREAGLDARWRHFLDVIRKPGGSALFDLTCVLALLFMAWKIGRASCRERVCQYVSISVVAVSLKKKQQIISRYDHYYTRTTS